MFQPDNYRHPWGNQNSSLISSVRPRLLTSLPSSLSSCSVYHKSCSNKALLLETSIGRENLKTPHLPSILKKLLRRDLLRWLHLLTTSLYCKQSYDMLTRITYEAKQMNKHDRLLLAVARSYYVEGANHSMFIRTFGIKPKCGGIRG